MRILLYLPTRLDSDEIYHEMTTRLSLALRGCVDIDLRHDLQSIDTLADYDLVHVMGCWGGGSAVLVNKARQAKRPIVYSPLGGLQPWVIKDQANNRHYATQRKAIAQASAIHVCGPLELATFRNLGWNKRVALIKNPVLTSLISFDEMSRDMLRLYRKAIDTHARLRLDKDQQQLIGDLLEIGVNNNKELAETVRPKLLLLDAEQWRMMLIYADDEDIYAILVQALQRMQVDGPGITPANIERFVAAEGLAKEPLPTDKLIKSSSHIRSKLSELLKPEQVRERQACIALCNMKYLVDHGKATMRHLTDVYKLFRFIDLDENLLANTIGELGVEPFSQRLVAVLAHIMHLTEGFFPFPAKYGKETEELEQRITKYGLWL